MKAVAIGGAILAGALVVLAVLVRLLARRVVGVEPRRKTISVLPNGDELDLRQDAMTLAAGNYGLWFGEGFAQHALIGPVAQSDGRRVVRRTLAATSPIPVDRFDATLTGHVMSGPADIDPDWEDVAVPLRGGGSAPAWLFRRNPAPAPWVIHVQGIRTSRLVTLRSVDVANRAGLTSLVITYRGSGDGPPASASFLGEHEWTDLADGIAFARAHGATEVYVVAWSMGAGIALELLRHDPTSFDRLALIAPATNWPRIIRHGVRRARLPGFVASILIWALGSRVASRLVGMPAPLRVDRLDWSRNPKIDVPTLVVHSKGDDEIPFELTQDFVAGHPDVTLVETTAAPHGWEANVDPDVFRSAIAEWLGKSA